MRVATTQVYRQSLDAFATQQAKLNKLQEQISTGVKINKPSDDPAASTRILELEQTVELYSQYQTNIDLAESRLASQESAIASMENILLRVRELALQANNATQDEASRRAITFEIEERAQALLALANTVDQNGDYLFAGFQNQSEPFTENTLGDVDYVQFNGDGGSRNTQISQSRQINVDTQGRDLLMAIPSLVGLNEFSTATNAGNAVIAPASVVDNVNYIADTYTISFDTVSALPDTVYNVVNAAGTTVASGTYVEGEAIEFMGIRTSVVGVPANNDSFTVSPGQYQDIFSIVNNLIDSIQSASTATATGSYTFGSAVTVFDYSVETASFEVDGNLISLNANYGGLDGLTTEIQNQLDLAVGTGIYQASHDGVTVSISQTTTGPASAAPVVNNFNGDVDGNGTPATSGSATSLAVSVLDYSGANDISFDVDGFQVILDVNYATVAGVSAEIQADLDATAGPGVYNVTDNGINITIARVATGAASTAPVINNPGGTGTNQAEFTGAATTNGVDAINTVADFTANGVSVNGQLDSSVLNANIAQALDDLDSGFTKLIEARTSIGGRLNALENQYEDNDAYILSTQKILSLIRDTDLAEAISRLTLEQTTLEAAQAVFTRITGSSLFSYLR
ncbi:MAG: flagellar hook-associated protein FlgL [Gammaproteobacteria bacterium]|nr:flagellar hook-associated protein FlgL [Gammaproteobacteria bacterium]